MIVFINWTIFCKLRLKLDMIMKRIFFNIFFLISAFAGIAQEYQFPMNKMARVNGTDVMFSSTPIANPNEVPLSSLGFFQKAFMQKEICVPPYKSHPTSFLTVTDVDRLDSALITTGDKIEKVIYLSDSMSVLQKQQIFDASGKLVSEIELKYSNGKETERIISFNDVGQVVYKIGQYGPLSQVAKTRYGNETLTWTYKNGLVSTATQTGSRGKESASFTWTPQKKLSSIKWKTGRGTIESLYDYSDYEASVVNPIVLVKDEKLSAQLWDCYSVANNKGQTLIRVNNLQEKKIYEINGGNRELISSYLLTFKPFAYRKGGSKNMLSHISYEGLTESFQETYDYTTDLKISKVVKSDKMIEYEYNGIGNIAKVVITPASGDKTEIDFYYTNIEEERQRIAEEKAKAEAERLAREAEEKARLEEEKAKAEAERMEKEFEEQRLKEEQNATSKSSESNSNDSSKPVENESYKSAE